MPDRASRPAKRWAATNRWAHETVCNELGPSNQGFVTRNSPVTNPCLQVTGPQTVSCTHECLRGPLRIDLLHNRAHNWGRLECWRPHSHPRNVSAEYFERIAMTRTVLILYLAATSLAGPWYCCCSVAQLSSLFRTAKEPAVVARVAPVCPSCCQHAPAKKSKTVDQA